MLFKAFIEAYIQRHLKDPLDEIIRIEIRIELCMLFQEYSEKKCSTTQEKQKEKHKFHVEIV